jgi:selenide,water dikinase
VWRLDDSRLLVVTTDFFTPVVDDPFDYGSIAAANSLSDLYAMGAIPFLALNIAALPEDLPPEDAREILRGGAEKAREAGAIIAGGHSVKDREPKYGLVALGMADRDHLMTKGAAHAGDVLFLTKPLGTGVTTTALKNGKAEEEDVRQVVSWMKVLNGPAAAVAGRFGVRAATDVTGYSLLGHASEIAAASQVALRFHAGAIPFYRGAQKYAAMGQFPGGSRDNASHYAPRVRFEGAMPDLTRRLLFDAQTSGGLLLCVPAERAIEFVAGAAIAEVPAWPIGTAIDGEGVEVLSGPMPGWERVGAAQVSVAVFLE